MLFNGLIEFSKQLRAWTDFEADKIMITSFFYSIKKIVALTIKDLVKLLAKLHIRYLACHQIKKLQIRVFHLGDSAFQFFMSAQARDHVSHLNVAVVVDLVFKPGLTSCRYIYMVFVRIQFPSFGFSAY